MSDVWCLDQSVAQLKTDHLQLRLNVARPHEGLRQVQCRGQMWPVERLLGIAIPGMDSQESSSVDECYLRGSDLIVRYAPTSAERYSPQVYWRYRASGQAVGLEVIISMQTDLLDSRPMVESTSAFPVGQLFCADADESFREASELGHTQRTTPVLLFRPADVPFSYVEMAYPSDVVGFTTNQDGVEQTESCFQLLHQHLERGVIRRLRVAAWFVSRDADRQSATELFRRLVQSAPPLEA